MTSAFILTNSKRAYARRGRHASRLWLVAAFAIVLAVSIFWWILPEHQNQVTPVKASVGASIEAHVVKWNSPISPAAAGIIVAQADGLFAREGLKIVLEGGRSDDDVIAFVTANDHVIGQTSASGFLRARAAGAPVVALASSFMISSVELYALSSTTLNAPGDLVGKTLGLDTNSDSGIVVEALIRAKHLPRSQIKVTEASATVSQLLLGRIDILAGRSNIEGEELRVLKIPFKIMNPAGFGVHSIGDVYIASEQMIAHQPDLAEKFLTALIRGWDKAYADYDRTIPIISEAIDRSIPITSVVQFMDRQRTYVRPFGARMGEFDFARWRDLHDRLLAQRLIKQAVDLRQAVLFSLVPDLYRTRLKTLIVN